MIEQERLFGELDNTDDPIGEIMALLDRLERQDDDDQASITESEAAGQVQLPFHETSVLQAFAQARAVLEQDPSDLEAVRHAVVLARLNYNLGGEGRPAQFRTFLDEQLGELVTARTISLAGANVPEGTDVENDALRRHLN